MTRLIPLILALLGAACSTPEKANKIREVIVVEGRGEAETEAGARGAARSDAVASALDVFLSETALRDNDAVIRDKILSQAAHFFKEEDIEEHRKVLGRWKIRVRAELLYRKLSAELTRLGLLRPDSLKGRPRILVSIKETPESPDQDGAANSLRRALASRGYAAFDLSDRPKGKADLGQAEPSRKAGREVGAEAMIVGTVSAVAAKDERLANYFPYRAEGTAAFYPTLSAAEGVPLEARATAVDLSAEPASRKALQNWGEALAQRAFDELAGRFKERNEITTVVAGISDWKQARAVIKSLRALPDVKDVSLEAMSGQDARLRIFAERRSDDVASAMLRLSDTPVRAMNVDQDYIELEVGD
jgi:hypothetical protein